jgi:tRNA(fMet)-specific endonuclease VapC
MRILLDTNVVSVILKERENPLLLEQIASFAPEDVHVTTVTVREVLYGTRKRQREDLEDRFEKLIAERVVVLPFDLAAARHCAELQVYLEALGTPLDLPDLEIASIALAHNLALVTGNTRHFRRIPGLRVYNWLDA